METVFKIHEPHHGHQSQDLMIELGAQVLSLVFYNAEERKVNALFQYHLKKNTPSSKIAEKLKMLFEDEVSHWQNIVSCRVFFNFRQHAMIPSLYYKKHLSAEMLVPVFGSDENTEVFSDYNYDSNAWFIYRVRKNVLAVINEYYPSASYNHSLLCAIKAADFAPNELRCVVYYNSFRVILYKGGKLHLMQYFDYNAPEDMAYHLVNICQQHQLNVDEVKLNLSGLIDLDSQLYKCLYNYFLNIDVLKPHDSVSLNSELQKHPEHFFSHLTSLIVCEL